MSTTPAVENASSTTSSVVQNTENVKALDDKTGAPIIRSGQKFDTSFTDAVIASYSNLANAPILCCVFVCTLILVLAETLEQKNGPLEMLLAALKKAYDGHLSNKFLQTLTALAMLLLRFVVNNKSWLLNSILLCVPYARKPSSKNLKLTILLVMVDLILSSQILICLLLSQMWFLVTELRNPQHKMLIIIFTTLIFLLTWIDLDSPSPKPDTRNVNPPVPPIKRT